MNSSRQKGARVPKGGGNRRGILSGIQGGMKDILALEFQLEQVDYTRENFVHADLSPEKFDAAMKERGESFLGMMFKMMGQSMALQAKMEANGAPWELELFAAIFAEDRPLRMKRIMAAQFENLDIMTQALGGDSGSTIIEGRNAAALDVLQSELAAGKKKLAIFYGAGHLSDMEQRLGKDFQLEFNGEDWLEAWNMRTPGVVQQIVPPAAPPQKAPAKPAAKAAAEQTKATENQKSAPGVSPEKGSSAPLLRPFIVKPVESEPWPGEKK